MKETEVMKEGQQREEEIGCETIIVICCEKFELI